MYFILAWVVICLLSPLLGWVYDKWKGHDDINATSGTGAYKVRLSAAGIVMAATPLLIIGLIVNWASQ